MRVDCGQCGTTQSPGWQAGMLCQACGGVVRPEVRCAWCCEWTPDANFCRHCGAGTVSREHFGVARMLKAAGVDRLSLADRVRALTPAQQEDYQRRYLPHQALLERQLRAMAWIDQWLLGCHEVELANTLVPLMPFDDDTREALELTPQPDLQCDYETLLLMVRDARIPLLSHYARRAVFKVASASFVRKFGQDWLWQCLHELGDATAMDLETLDVFAEPLLVLWGQPALPWPPEITEPLLRSCEVLLYHPLSARQRLTLAAVIARCRASGVAFDSSLSALLDDIDGFLASDDRRLRLMAALTLGHSPVIAQMASAHDDPLTAAAGCWLADHDLERLASVLADADPALVALWCRRLVIRPRHWPDTLNQALLSRLAQSREPALRQELVTALLAPGAGAEVVAQLVSEARQCRDQALVANLLRQHWREADTLWPLLAEELWHPELAEVLLDLAEDRCFPAGLLKRLLTGDALTNAGRITLATRQLQAGSRSGSEGLAPAQAECLLLLATDHLEAGEGDRVASWLVRLLLEHHDSVVAVLETRSELAERLARALGDEGSSALGRHAMSDNLAQALLGSRSQPSPFYRAWRGQQDGLPALACAAARQLGYHHDYPEGFHQALLLQLARAGDGPGSEDWVLLADLLRVPTADATCLARLLALALSGAAGTPLAPLELVQASSSDPEHLAERLPPLDCEDWGTGLVRALIQGEPVDDGVEMLLSASALAVARDGERWLSGQGGALANAVLTALNRGCPGSWQLTLLRLLEALAEHLALSSETPHPGVQGDLPPAVETALSADAVTALVQWLTPAGRDAGDDGDTGNCDGVVDCKDAVATEEGDAPGVDVDTDKGEGTDDAAGNDVAVAQTLAGLEQALAAARTAAEGQPPEVAEAILAATREGLEPGIAMVLPMLSALPLEHQMAYLDRIQQLRSQ
ncbi:hypothetical protein [Marinobacter xestospongiae]|uniref:hypothetical protein n=1 Tax=Marinobacter xestospongiae TaxID=994319 RepID=UPI002006D86E|nr:hypothetical protein [Marinobacter xestospongiae]MCK7565175.1 hypothetical protein [Marinobacter xestospongiae]